MHARRLALAAACLAALLAPSAHAAIVDETYSVPTVGGARISVEVQRDDKFPKQPIILTYSPYNTLSESPGGTVANDGIAKTYNPKGYARAVADVIGTRNSTGCWDYGGPREQQSGVDVVNYLAKLPWANGKVGMIGGSYVGTTANMVAVRGDDVPGLAAIVPQSAINHWYGYAYQDGVRYFGNTNTPSDEGIDTPLGFDFGLARTPPTQPDAASLPDLLTGRYNPCDSADHTAHGYDTTPDYDAFWLARDYLKDAGRFRVPVLVTHGWQDYNVKQSEGLDLYDALGSNVPFKILYMWQGPHGLPDAQTYPDYQPLLDRFFAHTLKGEDNGIEHEVPVHTMGRSGETVDKKPRTETAWPPPGTKGVAVDLGRTKDGGVLAAGAGGDAATYTDDGNGSEERAIQEGVTSEDGWRFYETAPLSAAVRLAGSALLDLDLIDSSDHGQISPTLVDVAPDGSVTPISRGHLNLKYRNGIETAQNVPTGRSVRARVRFAPQDQTVDAKHRIGVIVESSNTVWAVPDQQPGYDVTVRSGTSRLVLPVVGAPDAPTGLPGVATESAPLPDAGFAADRQAAFAKRRAGARRGRITVRARRVGRRLVVSGR